MTRAHRLSMSMALTVCLVGTQLNGTLFASAEDDSAKEANASTPIANAVSSTELIPANISSAADRQAISASGTSPALLFPPTRSRFTLDDAEIPIGERIARDPAQMWSNAFHFIPDEDAVAAQRGGYYGRGGYRGDHGAAAAIILGAAAMIAGSAILVYANRPDCSVNQLAGGCGYGTKVVGGAVLSAGIVGVLVGVATWR